MPIFARPVLLLLSLLWFAESYSQLSISGKVINDETDSVVAGASIYFNNTSIGTSSNGAGEFFFRSVDLINTELIVSSVGYEIMVIKINANANGKYFICRLSIKEQQLKDVLVLSDARRKQYLTIFRENFLGLTQAADRSRIVNIADVYFTMGENKSIFLAHADTPLVIINDMLGYKMFFQLIEFSFDDISGRTYFYGYTRYEELGEKKRWVKNRKEAYYGSTLHFYRALTRDQLDDEGYDLFIMKSIRKDSSAPPSMIAFPTTPAQIVSADSSDTAYFRITVPGNLMVRYRRNQSSKNYLAKKVFLQGNMKVGFRAFVTPRAPYFRVDHNGILENPLSVENGGYWIYERAANLLPYDYQPE